MNIIIYLKYYNIWLRQRVYYSIISATDLDSTKCVSSPPRTWAGYHCSQLIVLMRYLHFYIWLLVKRLIDLNLIGFIKADNCTGFEFLQNCPTNVMISASYNWLQSVQTFQTDSIQKSWFLCLSVTSISFCEYGISTFCHFLIVVEK